MSINLWFDRIRYTIYKDVRCFGKQKFPRMKNVVKEIPFRFLLLQICIPKHLKTARHTQLLHEAEKKREFLKRKTNDNVNNLRLNGLLVLHTLLHIKRVKPISRNAKLTLFLIFVICRNRRTPNRQSERGTIQFHSKRLKYKHFTLL